EIDFEPQASRTYTIGVRDLGGRTAQHTLRAVRSVCRGVEIIRPAGGETSPPPVRAWIDDQLTFRFDHQLVVSGERGAYPLSVEGRVDPASLVGRWSVDPAVGTLSRTRGPSSVLAPPATPGRGALIFEGEQPAVGIDKACRTSRRIEVFATHLDRDFANFGVGQPSDGQIIQIGGQRIRGPRFDCYTSTEHHLDGRQRVGAGNATTVITPVEKNWEFDQWVDPTPKDFDVLEADLKKGDVVALFRGPRPSKEEREQIPGTAVHVHTCLRGIQMYGANNEPTPPAPAPSATNRWFLCTSRAYYLAQVRRFPTERQSYTINRYRRPR
ncbi:MAG: hypothetical protein AAGA56_05925, partial [Myxococcota bacterium]